MPDSILIFFVYCLYVVEDIWRGELMSEEVSCADFLFYVFIESSAFVTNCLGRDLTLTVLYLCGVEDLYGSVYDSIVFYDKIC